MTIKAKPAMIALFLMVRRHRRSDGGEGEDTIDLSMIDGISTIVILILSLIKVNDVKR